jgi:uncharacterized protein involved in exopolysaccharide biosynthesis
VGGAITAAMTPRYVATSSVLINFADGTDGAGKPPALLYSGYLATQIDVLGSQNVALKVVDRLNLVDDAAARQRFLGTESSMEETLRRAKDAVASFMQRFMPKRPLDANDAADPGNERYLIADRFLKNSEVRPSPDSSVIQVGYSAPTARAAAEAANAIVQAYVDTTLELSVNPARSSSEWLDAQVERQTKEVQDARAKLTDFQQRSGIITTDANDADSARLNDLNSQLVAAQSQNHPAIQALKSDLARAQAKLNDLPPQLGTNHPTYKSTQAEVAALRSQLEEESARIASGLRGEIGSQRSSMLQMRKQHAQFATLKEAVDSAQRALDDTMQKASQTRLNSQMTQTNISVVRVAVPPRQPTTPNLAFNLALATALGIVVGIGMALWREVVCRFVRSADDIRDFLGVPVLGALHDGPRLSSARVRLPPQPSLLSTQ